MINRYDCAKTYYALAYNIIMQARIYYDLCETLKLTYMFFSVSIPLLGS